MRLGVPDHFAWLGLRRVKAGGVAKAGSAYVEHGRPLGLLLADVIEALVEQGQVAVGEVSPQDCLARVSLTEAGASRYAELCTRQRRRIDPDAGGR
ncbi:MAG: hypothetical protein ABR608_04605 [Pseudonocardiaceae bacterium]